jgi:hypothetical protein
LFLCHRASSASNQFEAFRQASLLVQGEQLRDEFSGGKIPRCSKDNYYARIRRDIEETPLSRWGFDVRPSLVNVVSHGQALLGLEVFVSRFMFDPVNVNVNEPVHGII